MPAVSVMLPCYQAAATLSEALDSLAAQTFTDYEIIAVDDGSTDCTLAILQARAAVEPRLRVLSIPHGGVIAAANTALAASRAPLVARMDADDRCDPRRLEVQFTYLQAHPEVDVLASQVRAFPDSHVQDGVRTYVAWQNSLLQDADIRREMFVESPLANPSVMCRKSVVVDAGGYEEHGWAEDYDLFLRFYLRGAHFARVPEVLLDWRDHPNRLTRQDERYSPENFINAKAHYLAAGPLSGRDAVVIWGGGSIGKRTGRALEQLAIPLRAYADVDPRKIGRTRRGLPVLGPEALPAFLKQWRSPIVLAAVGIRGAREIIRDRFKKMGLVEGQDWLAVA